MKIDSDTKSRIVEIAIEMFAEKGYENTSMREIAERVEISKPAIYYYFENKEQLFKEVIVSVIDGFARSVAYIFNSSLGPEEKLSELVRLMFRNAREKPSVFRIIHSVNMEDLRAGFVFDLRRKFEFMRENLLQVLDEGVRKGIFRSDIDGDVFVTCFNGAISLHILKFVKLGDVELTEKRAEQILELFLSGLRV